MSRKSAIFLIGTAIYISGCASTKAHQQNHIEIYGVKVLETSRAYGGLGIIDVEIENPTDQGICLPKTILAGRPTNHISARVKKENGQSVEFPDVGYILSEDGQQFHLPPGENIETTLNYNGLFGDRLKKDQKYRYSVIIAAEYCEHDKVEMGGIDLVLRSPFITLK
jgi:hypothetical protein